MSNPPSPPPPPFLLFQLFGTKICVILIFSMDGGVSGGVARGDENRRGLPEPREWQPTQKFDQG